MRRNIKMRIKKPDLIHIKKGLRLTLTVGMLAFVLTGCGQAESLAKEGITLLEEESYAQAADVFAEAIENNSLFDTVSKRDLQLYYAQALLGAGNYDEAIDVWEKLLSSDDEEGLLYYNIGLAQMALGAYEEAENAFLQAAENGYTAAYGYAGRAAIRQAEEADASAADSEDEQTAVVKAFYDKAVEYLELALDNVTEETETETESLELYLLIGECQAQLGNYRSAANYFAQGIEPAETAENDDILQKLLFQEAVCYEYLQDYDTARIKLAAYLEAYPDDADALKEYEFLQTR